jgi:predicted RNase H-like HicB family nuclease
VPPLADKRTIFMPCVEYDKISHKENIMRQVIIYSGEDGYFVAECPSLPGCISQGKTREEAIENIREAIQLYIEVLELENQPVPEEKFETILMAV